MNVSTFQTWLLYSLWVLSTQEKLNSTKNDVQDLVQVCLPGRCVVSRQLTSSFEGQALGAEPSFLL